jgi:hypothetical protein
MAAHYILGCLSVVFLVLGIGRTIRDGHVGPAARTWLLIGVIFGTVTVWTWLSAAGR